MRLKRRSGIVISYEPFFPLHYLVAVRVTFGRAVVNGNCQRKLCPSQSVVEIIPFLKLQNQDGNHVKCTWWTKNFSTNGKKFIANTRRSDMKL